MNITIDSTRTTLSDGKESFTLRHIALGQVNWSFEGAAIELLVVNHDAVKAVTEAELVRERFFPHARLVLDGDGLRFEWGHYSGWWRW